MSRAFGGPGIALGFSLLVLAPAVGFAVRRQLNAPGSSVDVETVGPRDGSAALKDVTTLTITGTFEYQACNDKVCFAPQSIPLSWSIGVKPLDRERAKPQ